MHVTHLQLEKTLPITTYELRPIMTSKLMNHGQLGVINESLLICHPFRKVAS